jgi:hypothetical protein
MLSRISTFLALYAVAAAIALGVWLYFHMPSSAMLSAKLAVLLAGIPIFRWFGARSLGVNFLVLAGLAVGEIMLVAPYTPVWLDAIIAALAFLFTGLGMVWSGGPPSQSNKEAIVASICILLLAMGAALLLYGGMNLPPLWLTVVVVIAVSLEKLSAAFHDSFEPVDRLWIGSTSAITVACAFVGFVDAGMPRRLREGFQEMLAHNTIAAFAGLGVYLSLIGLIIVLGRGWRHQVAAFLISLGGFLIYGSLGT